MSALSRETGFSPQKEEHDTQVVLPESRYDLSVLPPSLEFVAAICALGWLRKGYAQSLMRANEIEERILKFEMLPQEIALLRMR